MKITRIEAFALRFPRDDDTTTAYTIADGAWRSIYSNMHETMVVRITTDEGLVGYGEGQSPVSPGTSKTIIEDLCRPILIGADPFDVEYLWQKMYSAMRERGHPTGFFVDALAGCDIALWDLIGKAAGQPVHPLLGGAAHQRIASTTASRSSI